MLQELLLQHVSPYQMPYSYCSGGKVDRKVCYIQLSEHVCRNVAGSWQKWAFEIAEEDPSADTVRVLILVLLMELVSMEFPEETLPPALPYGCENCTPPAVRSARNSLESKPEAGRLVRGLRARS